MSGIGKKYDDSFTARIALEAIRGDRTVAEIAAAYGVHPNQIGKWTKQTLDKLPKVFSIRYEKKEAQGQELAARPKITKSQVTEALADAGQAIRELD